jgi:steroid delta-isomerase-like uncharacterized protein
MASITANKELVHRFIDALWNAGDLGVVDELTTPDFVNHSALPDTPPDRAGFAHTARTTRDIFPDFQVTLVELVADGDTVVAHFTAAGTHQLAWDHPIVGRITATGKAVTWRGVRLFHLRDGRIAATWVYVDTLDVVRQLGALSGLAQATG